MFLTKNFKPEVDSQANRIKANHWFDKALSFESEGKSDKMIDLALNKACDYETAALVV